LVKEVDQQIASLERTKAATPPTVKITTLAPNPFIDKLNEKISEATVDLHEKQQQLNLAQTAISKTDVATWGRLERTENSLKRDVEQNRSLLTNLTETGEKL